MERIRKQYGEWGIVKQRMHNMKAEGKPVLIKYVRLAILLSFIVGIVVANLMNKEQLSSLGIWSTYFVEQFKYSQFRSIELFYYILEERLPVILLLLLLASTGWGNISAIFFLAWQGFAIGFQMTAFVISYGIKGIILMGGALFPQYLLYIPLYIAYLYMTLFWGRRKDEGLRNREKMQKICIYLGASLLFLSVYITGIFLESYLNPIFLKKILKIF